MSLSASVTVIALAVTVSTTVVAGRVTLPAPLAVNVLPNGLSPRTAQCVDLLSDMTKLSDGATMMVRGRQAVGDGYEGIFDIVQGDFTAAVAADPAQAVFVPVSGVPVSQAIRKRRIVDRVHLAWFGGDPTGDSDSTVALNRAGDLAWFLEVGVYGGRGEIYLFGQGGASWDLTGLLDIDVTSIIRRSGTVATYDRGTDGDGNAIRFWTIHTPSTAMVLIGDLASGGGRPFVRISCSEAATYYDAIDHRTYRLSGGATSVPPTVKISGLKNFDLEPVMIDHLWLYGDGTQDKIADSNSYFDIRGGGAYEITINGTNGVQAVPAGGRNNGWNTRGRIYSRVIRASIGLDATGLESPYRQNDLVINGDFEGVSAFLKFGNCANIEVIGRFEGAPAGCIQFGAADRLSRAGAAPG